MIGAYETPHSAWRNSGTAAYCAAWGEVQMGATEFETPSLTFFKSV